MSEYTFRKGDTGKTRGGEKYEVLAEVKPRLDRPTRLAVLLNHSDGTSSINIRDLAGRWHYADPSRESVHDLMPPTEKRWFVRADYTAANFDRLRSITWEYSSKQYAEQNFEAIKKMPYAYSNPTIEEKEIVCQRSTS